MAKARQMSEIQFSLTCCTKTFGASRSQGERERRDESYSGRGGGGQFSKKRTTFPETLNPRESVVVKKEK
jgi:hypothetical protein